MAWTSPPSRAGRERVHVQLARRGRRPRHHRGGQGAAVEIVTEWHATPEWRNALERNNWTDTFSTGQEFERFIDREVATAQQIIKDLGL